MTLMCVFAHFPGRRNIRAFSYSMPTNSQHIREFPFNIWSSPATKLGFTNAPCSFYQLYALVKGENSAKLRKYRMLKKTQNSCNIRQSRMLTCSNAARVPPKNESSHPVWHHQSPCAPADLFAEWHRCIYQL